MTTALTIELGESDADAELLEQLTYSLREELLETPVESVAVPQVGDAPEGSRALGIVAIGALLVDFAGSADALKQVVGVVRSWFNKKPAERTLKITIGANVLELTAATDQQQQQLIDEFVERASAG